MKKMNSHKRLSNIASIYMVVVMLFANFPLSAFAGGLSVDLKANGQDSLVLATSTDSFEVVLSTGDTVTACLLQTPKESGIATSSTMVINPDQSGWYPAIGGEITYTVSCTDGAISETDSVTISLPALTPTPTPEATVPTVDLKANGSDGPITITQGDSYTYSWTSTNATSCLQKSPKESGAELSGGDQINSDHPTFYPAVGSSVTITIDCTDGVKTATDSVVINVVARSTGGGGGNGGSGGGSRSGGHRRPIDTPSTACLYVKDYMRMDFNNDPAEVMKLQAFLKVIMGYNYVNVNGIYDQATFSAVSQFQMTYKDDILTPWGHTAPTGYTYILTLKKVNEIYCRHVMPLSEAQQHEILAFRALIQGLRAQGYGVETTVVTVPGKTIQIPVTTITSATSTATSTVELPVVGQNIHKGQILRNLASAVFSFPSDLQSGIQCLYEWLLILIVLYILGSVLKDVFYKDLPENVLKRFLTKWITISLGLIVAILVAYMLGEWCLILPLLIVLVISLIIMALFPKHNSIRSSIKSWYIVLSARSKSMRNSKKADSTTTTTTVIEETEKKD